MTRNITLILAIIQSIGVTLYLRPILFDWNVILASQIVIWLTAGAMIVLWLSELITDYGLGNGTSLLVYTNIVSNLPNLIGKIAAENKENTVVLSMMSTFGLGVLILVALYAIVLLQNSTLRINLISSKRLSRVSQYDNSESDRISYLPLRFNQAGVMPIILTTSVLVIPNYLINLGIFQSLNFLINFKWVYWIGYFALILAFSSFYSSIVLNPKDISDQLQKSAVKIPGDGGEQAGTTGTSSVTVFLPTLLFSSSSFYYLFCCKLQQQTGRGQVGRDRTGRRQQCGRDEGQAGGRRR